MSTYNSSVSVILSDTINIPQPEIYKSNAANISDGYSLYFGTTGSFVVEDVSGNQVTLSNVTAGKVIDLLVVKVLETGSTKLTDIVALQNI